MEAEDGHIKLQFLQHLGKISGLSAEKSCRSTVPHSISTFASDRFGGHTPYTSYVYLTLICIFNFTL